MDPNKLGNVPMIEATALKTEGATALEAEPEFITREQRRSRRKRDIRARTISVKRMTKRELEIGRMLYPETDYWKPRTRVDPCTVCSRAARNTPSPHLRAMCSSTARL